MGVGIEAKNAPYFPRIEKKIMNPADIWTTLLLPTRVCAIRPAFSTETEDPIPVPNNPDSKIPTPCQPAPRLSIDGGTGVPDVCLAIAIKEPVD